MYSQLKRIGTALNFVLKIAFMLAFIFPLLWMISTSLKTFDETMRFPPIWIPASPQWVNFKEAMTAGPFLTFARNSITITLTIIVLQFLVMLPAAYSYAKYKFPLKNFLFALVLLAFMIPHQITFIPVYLLFGDWKLLNTLLPQIIPFLANAFGIFLMRQYFMQIPDDLIEAARIDGAGEFKIIWRIMVPMAVPAMATIALFSFVAHWNDYFWPLVMTNANPVRPLTVGIAMLKTTEGLAHWHIIMAANVVLVVPIIIVYLFASKQIVKSFVYSGIK